MANEIKIVASLACLKGSFNMPANSNQVQATQTGVGGGVPGTVAATTAGVDISTTGLTTPGWARLQNLDSINWVDFGVKVGGTFYPCGRMLAGEPTLLRLSAGNTGTWHLKADTATCKVRVEILEA